MKENIVSSRYAKALFDFAVEKKATDKIYEDMQIVQSTIESNKELKSFLKSPIIRFEKKQATLASIFGNKINEISLTYISIIAKKRREHLINNIAGHYISLYKEYKGIQVAKVITAFPLENALKEKIISKLQLLVHKQIEITEIIDPSIIGGFIIKINDTQYDSSILNKIQRLNKEFEQNEYIKGF